MRKFYLALASIALAAIAAFAARAQPTGIHDARNKKPEPKVFTTVLAPEFLDPKNTFRYCFTSKGGIEVRTFDNKCPRKKQFNKVEQSLYTRLHSSRKLLKGTTVIFTRHVILWPQRGEGVSVVNGVTYWHRLAQRNRIIITTNAYSDCSPTDTLKHELGHAAFNVVGIESAFLDVPEKVRCNWDEESELVRVVMTDHELPPGPVRFVFELTKPADADGK